eukprot:scaffold551_cov395-Prasinococcus_capsulatus_cf.AAC.19
MSKKHDGQGASQRSDGSGDGGIRTMVRLPPALLFQPRPKAVRWVWWRETTRPRSCTTGTAMQAERSPRSNVTQYLTRASRAPSSSLLPFNQHPRAGSSQSNAPCRLLPTAVAASWAQLQPSLCRWAPQLLRH